VDFIDEIRVLEDWEIVEITFSNPSKSQQNILNQAVLSVTQCIVGL
jgi:hypothetical protein